MRSTGLQIALRGILHGGLMRFSSCNTYSNPRPRLICFQLSLLSNVSAYSSLPSVESRRSHTNHLIRYHARVNISPMPQDSLTIDDQPGTQPGQRILRLNGAL